MVAAALAIGLVDIFITALAGPIRRVAALTILRTLTALLILLAIEALLAVLVLSAGVTLAALVVLISGPGIIALVLVTHHLCPSRVVVRAETQTQKRARLKGDPIVTPPLGIPTKRRNRRCVTA